MTAKPTYPTERCDIRPGEDGTLYISLYQKEPFHWKKLAGGRWW
jgi:hypothetical protein